MLGRKQRIEDEDWKNALNSIEETVTRKEIEDLVKKTVKEIKKTVTGKTAAYAWSAGKDSIVLSMLCRKAGVKPCMIALTNLEYPEFTKWIEDHSPDELEVINTGQDLEWLSKHSQMLFPQDSSIASKWFHVVQHRAQDKYYKEHNLDCIILGRRRADGNYVGKGSNSYTTAKGVCRYSPMADWSHEEVLACIHYYSLELPPIYGYKNGYKCGTHPWAARPYTGSEENGWEEIYEICPEIVQNASEYFPKAQEYLRSKIE